MTISYIKEAVHTMHIVSSFTDPHVTALLFDLLLGNTKAAKAKWEGQNVKCTTSLFYSTWFRKEIKSLKPLYCSCNWLCIKPLINRIHLMHVAECRGVQYLSSVIIWQADTEYMWIYRYIIKTKKHALCDEAC